MVGGAGAGRAAAVRSGLAIFPAEKGKSLHGWMWWLEAGGGWQIKSPLTPLAQPVLGL